MGALKRRLKLVLRFTPPPTLGDDLAVVRPSLVTAISL